MQRDCREQSLPWSRALLSTAVPDAVYLGNRSLRCSTSCILAVVLLPWSRTFLRPCRSPALRTIVRGRLSAYPTCRLCAGQRHSVDRRRLDANATYCVDPIGTASRLLGVPGSDYLTFPSSIPTFHLDCLFEIENVTDAASASKIGNCVAPGQAAVLLFVFLQEFALARDRVTTHLASIMGCVLGIRSTVPLAVAL